MLPVIRCGKVLRATLAVNGLNLVDLGVVKTYVVAKVDMLCWYPDGLVLSEWGGDRDVLEFGRYSLVRVPSDNALCT